MPDLDDVLPFVVFFGGFGALAWFVFERPLRRRGYRWGRRPPRLEPDHRFAQDVFTARVGARVGLLNATVGFVTLRADEHFVHLGVSAPVRLFAPIDLWIERAQVVSTPQFKTTLSRGIRFETADGILDGVLVWTSADATLAALERLGWPVERV